MKWIHTLNTSRDRWAKILVTYSLVKPRSKPWEDKAQPTMASPMVLKPRRTTLQGALTRRCIVASLRSLKGPPVSCTTLLIAVGRKLRKGRLHTIEGWLWEGRPHLTFWRESLAWWTSTTTSFCHLKPTGFTLRITLLVLFNLRDLKASRLSLRIQWGNFNSSKVKTIISQFKITSFILALIPCKT